MTFRRTKRVSIYAVVAWLCLLAFVVIVRATNVALGSVQPEAVMLTFMMTLPFQIGLAVVVIGLTALVDYLSGRSKARANPAG